MRFKFLDIPVHIHPSFWVFLLFFTDIITHFSVHRLILGLVVILSLLVHEYGHAVTARYFGAKPLITLEAFGGNASYNNFNISPKQEFFITLNGPLLESLLIVLPYFLLRTHHFDQYPYVHYALMALFRINTIWCLLNLIPILPLDGGHLLRYLLGKKFGLRGFKASILIGVSCVAIVIPYLVIHGSYFFALLLAFFAIQNYQMLSHHNFSPKEGNLSFGFNRSCNIAIDDENAIYLKKLMRSKDPQIKTSAIESLAAKYYEKKDCQKAYQLLLHCDQSLLKEGKHLLCKLAFQQNNYQLVAAHSQDSYKINPTFETAILNSKAFALLGQAYLAGGWLKTASLFGEYYRHEAAKLIHDKIYEYVKEDQDFQFFASEILSFKNSSVS